MGRNKRKPDPKKVVPAYLSDDVYARWDDWCQKNQRGQGKFMSKVITFVMGLDKTERAVFFEDLETEDLKHMARKVLRRISKTGKASIWPDGLVDHFAEDVADQSAGDVNASIKKKGTRRKRA